MKRSVIFKFALLSFLQCFWPNSEGFAQSIRATIPLVDAGGMPVLSDRVAGQVVVNPNTNRIYVPYYPRDGFSESYVAIVDGNTNVIVGTIILNNFYFYGGIDVNANTNRIYVTGWISSGAGLAVIDG